jgi:hypothetical protein
VVAKGKFQEFSASEALIAASRARAGFLYSAFKDVTIGTTEVLSALLAEATAMRLRRLSKFRVRPLSRPVAVASVADSVRSPRS